MQKVTFLLFILSCLSCNKASNEPDTVSVNLAIISTNTPRTLSQGQNIISNVRCSGSDLCYSFSHFETTNTDGKIFNISAKGNYPNSKKGDVICLQAIYYKDTTVSISTPSKGQYVLRFYNNNQLSKSDTVQVN